MATVHKQDIDMLGWQIQAVDHSSDFCFDREIEFFLSVSPNL